MLPRRSFLAGTLALASCKTDDRPVILPPVFGGGVSMSASAWQILYSTGMPPNPLGEAAGWFFDFPASGSVHYITTNVGASLLGRGRMRTTFAVQGSGHLKATQGDAPARVRLFFQRRGDDLSAIGPMEFYRWWSVAYVELVEGQFVLEAPFVGAEWSSVLAKRGDEKMPEFATALSDASSVGVTFGGSFAGHGVFVETGQARFSMSSFAVE